MDDTISERLRRLHRLYLAHARAVAADCGSSIGSHRSPAGRLVRTAWHRIHDDIAAVEAACNEQGRTAEECARIRETVAVDLREAARRQARLGNAQAAYRDAEKSGAYVPKSALVEQRRQLRQEADRAEHAAQRAIREVLDAFAGTTDADLAERKLHIAEPNG